MQRPQTRSWVETVSMQWLSLWAVFWLLIAGALGCTKPNAASTVQSSSEAGSSEPLRAAQSSRLLAWELQIADSQFTLLGSVHVGRAELYPLDPRLESRFAVSDALILELDTGKLDKSVMAEKIRQYGSVAVGQSLRQLVSEETFRRLEKALVVKGIPVAAFSQYRPWFVATILTQQSLQAAGFEPRLGIDEHFRLQAQRAGKRIIGLESLETQLSLLGELAPEVEESLLSSTLEELAEHGKQLAAALKLWRRGETEALDALLLQPLREQHPSLFVRIFVDRNVAMIQRLKAIAQQPGRYFVVVGAGHLMGLSGMVDLFSRQGIVARQL